MAMNTTPKLKGSSTGKFDQDWKGSEGAGWLRPIPGPQTQGRNRFLSAVSTTAANYETVEWPSGADITEVTVFCTPAYHATNTHVGAYGIITIDAVSDAAALSSLTQAESTTSDINWYPIPINEIVRIPLTSALVNGSLGGGRVDALAVGVALDFWIGGN